MYTNSLPSIPSVSTLAILCFGVIVIGLLGVAIRLILLAIEKEFFVDGKRDTDGGKAESEQD